jgi:hypothetical protein
METKMINDALDTLRQFLLCDLPSIPQDVEDAINEVCDFIEGKVPTIDVEIDFLPECVLKSDRDFSNGIYFIIHDKDVTWSIFVDNIHEGINYVKYSMRGRVRALNPDITVSKLRSLCDCADIYVGTNRVGRIYPL